MASAKVSRAALLLSICLGHSIQFARADVPPSASAQAYSIHDSLLKCYLGMGMGPETEAEYRWLLAVRPNNASYHFNYALFLQHAGKKAAALEEYKKAAKFDSGNVDFVGSAGQMLLYMGNYAEAYQYLGRAMQLPAGDKYKASCESARTYLQNDMQNKLIRNFLYDANPPPYRLPFSKPPLGEPNRFPSSKSPSGEDDD